MKLFINERRSYVVGENGISERASMKILEVQNNVLNYR